MRGLFVARFGCDTRAHAVYRDSPRCQAMIGFCYFLGYGIRRGGEVKQPGNQEQTAHLQTAHLQTALLHLLCGPRYEPLGGGSI